MCAPYLASNLHLDTDIKWQRNKICLDKLVRCIILIANMLGFKGLQHTPSSLLIPACGKVWAAASSSSCRVPHHDGLYPGTLGPNKPFFHLLLPGYFITSEIPVTNAVTLVKPNLCDLAPHHRLRRSLGRVTEKPVLSPDWTSVCNETVLIPSDLIFWS